MSLQKIFYPKSIAIVGASATVGSVGNDLVTNLTTFKGKVFLINPYLKQISNQSVFSQISDLEEIPELAIIAVPAKLVPLILKEAAEFGVKNFIVISAGFKEISKAGKKLEKTVLSLVQDFNLTLVGVNCLGVMNPEIGLNATFAPSLAPKGGVALVSQSGALCTAVIDLAKEIGLGFSKIISIGNKTSLSEVEVFEYLNQDVNTRVIATYLEDIVDISGLLTLAPKLTKPVIVLKSGRSESGQKATKSHTGALSGGDTLYTSIFERCGFLETDTLEEFLQLALVLELGKLPAGDNVAIITNAGGMGSLTVDSLEKNGLKISKLDSQTEIILQQNLPIASNTHNPVDVLGDALSDRYKIALQTVLKDKNVDSVVVILTPQSSTQEVETAKVVINLSKTTPKPIFTSFLGGKKVARAKKMLAKFGIANFSFPENISKSLAFLKKYRAIQTQINSFKNQQTISNSTFENLVSPTLSKNYEKIEAILNQAKKNNLTHLPEYLSSQILSLAGFSVTKSFLVNSPEEATQALEKINSKGVFKIMSPQIIHKSDAGGVILNVETNQAITCYKQIINNVKKYNPEATIEGVLVAEQVEVKNSFEFILGLKTEVQKQKLLMLGIGGKLVELNSDVVFEILPINKSQAINLISKVRASKLFDGFRDIPPLNKEKLVDAILKLALLAESFPSIQEIDLNPILVSPEQIAILDSRILLAS